MQFAIDDLVLYTPNMKDPLFYNQRPNDHGIVIGLDGNYVIIQFTNSYKTKIISDSISFLPCTLKYFQNIFKTRILPQMMKYIKIKIMRPIFEEKTNTNSILGPFLLIKAFL